jgi:filamentous hemagglutinin
MSALNVDIITDSIQSGASVVASVRAGAGAHAIVVESVQSGRAFIKDPWPVGVGSSYSVPIDILKSVLTGSGVVIRP